MDMLTMEDAGNTVAKHFQELAALRVQLTDHLQQMVVALEDDREKKATEDANHKEPSYRQRLVPY